MKARGTNWLALSVILLATAAVYANSLSHPFVPDDRHIIFINFPQWKSWTFGDLFQRSLFSTSPSEIAYFRPLTLLTFALNKKLAGENPGGYRAVNVGFHLLVVATLFLLFRRLADSWLATWASLIYAVHPVHVQAVTYISSRSDPIYTLLALLCLLLWHGGNESQQSHRKLYLGFALGAFFVGMFAKETMIVLIPLAGLMDLTWKHDGSWHDRLKRNVGWYAALLALFAVYLLIRSSLGYAVLMESGIKLDPVSRLLIALKLFGLYAGLAFYPAHLSLFRTVDVPHSFLEPQVLMGTGLLAGLLLLAWLIRQRCKEVSFGLLWYFIALLPVLNLTLLNAPMMEHWLYLPLMGLVLAFVAGLRIVAQRIGEIRGAAIGLTLLALLLSARTITRNAEWEDLVGILSQDVTYYPRNSRAWGWLASTLKSRGKLDEAIRAYKTSLEINPNTPETWNGIGEALSFVGKEKEAEEALSRAASLSPRNAAFHYVLGMHRLKAGRNLAAINALEKSTALSPGPMAYHALGSAYLRLADEQKAEQAFQKALALYPGGLGFHADMHVHLGKLYRLQHKTREAREEWQIALRFDPAHPEALRLLGQYSQ